MTFRVTTRASLLAVALALAIVGDRAQAQSGGAGGPTLIEARSGFSPLELPRAGVGGTFDYTPASDDDEEPSLAKHLGVGFLAGAVAGLAVGLLIDKTADGDGMVPATLGTVPIGAAAGMLVGGIVWLGTRNGPP